MTLLHVLPEKICADLKPAITGLKSCEVHWGKLDLGELKKRGAQMPGILVAPQGSREKQHAAGGFLAHGLSVAAYILTRDQSGAHRTAVASRFAEGLLKTVPDNDWDLNGVGQAEDVRFHVLDTTEIRSQGIALWAVTWLQPFTLFEPENATNGVEVHVAQAPAIGTAHADDYDQIGGAS